MDELFDLPPTAIPAEPAIDHARARPRLQRADREQVELRPTHLDALLPADHRARAVWDFVQGLDLSPLHDRIRAVEGHPGRPPIDPAILAALWLYATLEGVGSARALARLVDEHDAYRWIAGGVGVNHHTLADFRVADPDVLDGILTTSVAALAADGLVTLGRVALDGMRVRAAAGDGSFRRQDTLERALEDAEARVAALRAELEDDPAATSRRVVAARTRAARERAERVRAALGRLPALEAARRRARRPPVEQRASTTDPDARVMKLADGGYRPALNAQLATDVASGVIVGVDVIGIGFRPRQPRTPRGRPRAALRAGTRRGPRGRRLPHPPRHRHRGRCPRDHRLRAAAAGRCRPVPARPPRGRRLAGAHDDRPGEGRLPRAGGVRRAVQRTGAQPGPPAVHGAGGPARQVGGHLVRARPQPAPSAGAPGDGRRDRLTRPGRPTRMARDARVGPSLRSA